MKNVILGFLVSGKGTIAKIVLGIVAYGLARFSAYAGITIPEDILNEISIGVGIGVPLLIETWVSKQNASGIKEIQEALPPSVKTDGVAGPATVEAVQNLADYTPPNP